MNRTVKDYQERREEILAVAQELFFSKGYEDTSVQQIIDAVGIAKGTFYHYFDSKVDLLDALVASMTRGQFQMAQTILQEPELDAAQKLERLFLEIGGWKTDKRGFFLDILPIWYSDENLIVRYKLTSLAKHTMQDVLARIIRQGLGEGIFSTPYPEHTGDVVLGVIQNTSEEIALLLIDMHSKEDVIARLEGKLAVNQYAVNLLLGAQPGTVKIFDLDRIKLWFK